MLIFRGGVLYDFVSRRMGDAPNQRHISSWFPGVVRVSIMVHASTVGEVHCVVALVYPYAWAQLQGYLDPSYHWPPCIMHRRSSFFRPCASSCLPAHGSMHAYCLLPPAGSCSILWIRHACLPAVLVCRRRLRSSLLPLWISMQLASHACPLIGVLASWP
jgi:hypothetical protein